MPFLDRLELAAVSGVPDRSAYRAVAALEREGLAASVPHSTVLLPYTRRFYLTVAGLRHLARYEDIALDDLIRAYPVSKQWRRILMERLDAIAVIYRLASSIASEQGPIALRWYRSGPLDAVIRLPDGRTIGVVRQGVVSDRTGFAKRLWRLKEGPGPGAILMLMSDEVRLRHARRLLLGAPFTSLLALERDASSAGPTYAVWRLPSVAPAMDLQRALTLVRRTGAAPAPARQALATLPDDVDLGSPGSGTPDWLLPAILKASEKRLLDLLYDWPGIGPQDLCGLLGVSIPTLYGNMASPMRAGLIRRVSMDGVRLALSDRGLALLARRDRASVGAARKRWSVKLVDRGGRERWRSISGRRSRQLIRNLEHTSAVHGFMSALARQARSRGWDLSQIDPPFRASRHFRHWLPNAQSGDLRSIHPDAFGVLRRGAVVWPFFLEWERRAVRPAAMNQRLAPYLRYYSSYRPIDDHGVQPVVLIVFGEELTSTHFLRLAGREMQRAGVDVPLRVSHKAVLDDLGPIGRAWRAPGSWELTDSPFGG